MRPLFIGSYPSVATLNLESSVCESEIFSTVRNDMSGGPVKLSGSPLSGGFHRMEA
ncbi:MAG: hypothetical protein IPK82_20570 [Polyangiaceae bacterium]|nr:hypothetical protein [Polyangiaceae bacterium]MBK8255040.1 hypothetical protein [Polyangiaceae bacterium]